MTATTVVFKVGTRASNLALVQTRGAIEHLCALLPGARFEEHPLTTPGDRDRTTDLRVSPPDFFTRDLDDALRAGAMDLAVHSAKDLPEPMPADLDWCWLPWREDPRDAWVMPAAAAASTPVEGPRARGPSGSAPLHTMPIGRTLAELSAAPRVGVSSARREAYCRRRFPQAVLLPIRGTIEERLAQLDAGQYDVLLMAGAALLRLGLSHRITEWIPTDDLPPPDGQGVLALTFRAGDPRGLRLRSLLVKAVAFIGAGIGESETCTLAAVEALRRCEVCLYDALMPPALLELLPVAAERVDVGKRCGRHGKPQADITNLIARYARRGLRVARLKGGDPGIFGRLAEEVEALDALHLPYRVLPGISSLQMATTGTGMLLTRRGVSRGFCVMTPRREGGGTAPVGAAERGRLPLAFFMGASVVGDVAAQLRAEGWAPDTPAVMVWEAGGEAEAVVRGTLASPPVRDTAPDPERPGILLVGETARHGYHREWGALAGRRVLLTCSEALLEEATERVRDLGGIPVRRPLIRLQITDEALARIGTLADTAAGGTPYHWIVLTSPSAARCFVDAWSRLELDVRAVPFLMVCGPGTARALRRHGFHPAAEPQSEFGAEGLLATAPKFIAPGARVLRLRSDKAGDAVAQALRQLGAQVEDCILYRNETIRYAAPPAFEAVFFASASAVEALVAQWGADVVRGKTVAAIGQPTVRALMACGLTADAIGVEATVEGGLMALAGCTVGQELERLSQKPLINNQEPV